jgi:hypothetical protein
VLGDGLGTGDVRDVRSIRTVPIQKDWFFWDYLDRGYPFLIVSGCRGIVTCVWVWRDGWFLEQHTTPTTFRQGKMINERARVALEDETENAREETCMGPYGYWKNAANIFYSRSLQLLSSPG